MDKTKTVITMIAILFLVFVGYNKFSLPLDVVHFNPDYLYEGKFEYDDTDPKSYYNLIYGITFTGEDDNLCDISIKSYDDAITIGSVGSYLFVPSNGESSDTDFTSVIGKDGSGMFEDGKEIIMPVNNSKFKNTNISDSTMSNTVNGRKDIEIMMGDQVLIVFEDVITWWCHSKNPAINIRHNEKVGAKYNDSFRAGSILGISKGSTKIKVYQIKDEFYVKDAYNISDVKNLNELNQIDTGLYLVNGEIRIV